MRHCLITWSKKCVFILLVLLSIEIPTLKIMRRVAKGVNWVTNPSLTKKCSSRVFKKKIQKSPKQFFIQKIWTPPFGYAPETHRYLLRFSFVWKESRRKCDKVIDTGIFLSLIYSKILLFADSRHLLLILKYHYRRWWWHYCGYISSW